MIKAKTLLIGFIDTLAVGWIVFFMVMVVGNRYAKDMEVKLQYERSCELVLISGKESYKRVIYTNDDPEVHDVLHGHDGSINMIRSYHHINCKEIKKPE